jgi:hypothetical protein
MILIAGDSWGAGEFQEVGDGISHPGFLEYFDDIGVNALNISKPGGSNFDTYESLKNFLMINYHYRKKIKGIIVWKTEWWRDYRAYNINLFNSLAVLHEELKYGYSSLKSRWVERFYIRLNELYNFYHIPFYVIGGCSDALWFDNKNEYPGVNVICQSATNLLLNSDHRINNPILCEFVANNEFVEIIKKYSKNPGDISELLVDIDLGNNRIKQFKDAPELFYPDGIHPNRTALKTLFDFIVQDSDFKKVLTSEQDLL